MSNLRPLAFILCISDFPNVCSIIRFHINADDTRILYKVSDPNTGVNVVSQKMTKITDWFAWNKLN